MGFQNHFLNDLIQRHDLRVAAIESATANSQAKQNEVQKDLRELLESLPVDIDLIICGSLARGEFTNGSDVDWTLMIDGAVQFSTSYVKSAGSFKMGSLNSSLEATENCVN